MVGGDLLSGLWRDNNSQLCCVRCTIESGVACYELVERAERADVSFSWEMSATSLYCNHYSQHSLFIKESWVFSDVKPQTLTSSKKFATVAAHRTACLPYYFLEGMPSQPSRSLFTRSSGPGRWCVVTVPRRSASARLFPPLP
jgi:hypothetical protein